MRKRPDVPIRDLIPRANYAIDFRHFRISQRITQAELAKIVGKQRWDIANIENSKVKPSNETLNKICEHFGYTFEIKVFDSVDFNIKFTKKENQNYGEPF